MKTMNILALAAALVAPFAVQADSKTGFSMDILSENGLRVAHLDRCGGTATLVRENRELLLKIRESNCANLQTKFETVKLLGEGSNHRWRNVVINESVRGWHNVLVGSNAYIESNGVEGNGDLIAVYVPKQNNPTIRVSENGSNSVSLDDCGGTASAKMINGKLKVIYSGLEKCSKYDLLKNNDQDVSYTAEEMYGDSGSMTIPRTALVHGWNNLEVRFYKPGAREDRVNVSIYLY